MDRDPNLKDILYAVALMFMLGLLWLGLLSRANETQYYMVLEQGVGGLALDCVSELPYADGQQMDWSPERGFPNLGNDYTLLMQVVEVSFCNVDNIYWDNESSRYFRWGMQDREWSNDNTWDVHIKRGAFWVRLISFEVILDD